MFSNQKRKVKPKVKTPGQNGKTVNIPQLSIEAQKELLKSLKESLNANQLDSDESCENDNNEEEYDTITVYREEKRGEKIVDVEIHDNQLQRFLIDIMHDHSITYGPVNIQRFLPHYEEIKSFSSASELSDLIYKEFKDLLNEWKNTIKKGKIGYNMLWMIFKKDQMAIGKNLDELSSGKILRTMYYRSFFSSSFKIFVTQIKSDGLKFFSSEETLMIPEFEGFVDIKNLPVQILKKNSKEYRELKTRGKLYSEIACDAHYLDYDGFLFVKTWWNTIRHNSKGRVMIDIGSFKRNNNGEGRYNDEEEVESTEQITEIPDDMLHATHPFVYGFSMRIKKWGMIAVSKLKNIKFDDKAFDYLVLDKEKKTLISSLVINSENVFTDIISGKSGGCIFLLHGPPGTGKTLTAEAIAEKLHRPLYSISVGELGVEPDDLEKRLREILEMADVWNAVVLIDEADIFLEKRGDDILRNAMVGIFLRLLEYHQGIMFLTTNRVVTFDKAFMSRISMSLNYPEHNKESISKIWKNLLAAAGIKGKINIENLLSFNLNGREVKTAIRLSQSLANAQNTKLTTKHIIDTLKIQTQFNNDLEKEERLERGEK